LFRLLNSAQVDVNASSAMKSHPKGHLKTEIEEAFSLTQNPHGLSSHSSYIRGVRARTS